MKNEKTTVKITVDSDGNRDIHEILEERERIVNLIREIPKQPFGLTTQ